MQGNGHIWQGQISQANINNARNMECDDYALVRNVHQS